MCGKRRRAKSVILREFPGPRQASGTPDDRDGTHVPQWAHPLAGCRPPARPKPPLGQLPGKVGKFLQEYALPVFLGEPSP